MSPEIVQLALALIQVGLEAARAAQAGDEAEAHRIMAEGRAAWARGLAAWEAARRPGDDIG